MEQDKKIILFQEKQVRRVWHNDEWVFSVIDVVGILTDSIDPRGYWKNLKHREPQLVSNCYQLKLPSSDGKSYKSDCANTEGLLRIIMSVPSPKAEPFKLWLAQVGAERIADIENPELMTERQAELYRAKGYPDEWITWRMKSIEVRKQLTDEWKNRGVTEGHEYSILTAEIAKATFGVTPVQHGKIKGLADKDNLRDHMTNLELIFTALGEESTRAIAESHNAQGFNENHEAAQRGGKIAGDARKRLEKQTGKKVVVANNYKELKKGSKTD